MKSIEELKEKVAAAKKEYDEKYLVAMQAQQEADTLFTATQNINKQSKTSQMRANDLWSAKNFAGDRLLDLERELKEAEAVTAEKFDANKLSEEIILKSHVNKIRALIRAEIDANMDDMKKSIMTPFTEKALTKLWGAGNTPDFTNAAFVIYIQTVIHGLRQALLFTYKDTPEYETQRAIIFPDTTGGRE